MAALNEHTLLIREAMINGLSPDPRVPRNAAYAEYMLNLQATPYCAATPDAIAQPSGITNGIPVTDWSAAGVPRIVMGERSRWHLGNTQVSSADASWNLTPVGAAFTAGGPWQSVFFLEIPFFTNGTVFLWGTSAARVTDPVVSAVGKHESRLLLGGMSGTVFSGAIWGRVFQQWKNRQPNTVAYSTQAWDTGWIMFGEQQGGSSDRPFDALLSLLLMYTSQNQQDLESYVLSELERGAWGMCPLRYPGAVVAFHELVNGPVVFGENGVARLVPDGGIYHDQRIGNSGIGGRGCVGGSLDECLYLDAQRSLWRITPGTIERLDFAHHLGGLTLANTTISYDAAEQAYWIADKDAAYVLHNGKLSGPMTAFSSGVVRDAGALYGLVNNADELVSNGGFDSGTGWTANTGWAIGSGVLTGTTASTSTTQAIGATAGESYIVRYRVATRTAGSVTMTLGTASGTARTAAGTYSDTITCAGGTGLSITGTGFSGTVDNVSVTPANRPIEFRSMPLDIARRGTKMLTAMQVGKESITALKGGCHYRYDDDEAYAAGPMSPATDAGAVMCYPKVSFADAKAVVTGKVAQGSTGRLERIQFQYQGQDITFQRGTAAVPEQP